MDVRLEITDDLGERLAASGENLSRYVLGGCPRRVQDAAHIARSGLPDQLSESVHLDPKSAARNVALTE